jgi:hypothetical protein
MTMKRVIAVFMTLFSMAVHADPDLAICHGEYALCASSATEPTGKTMTVGSKTFQEGHAVCPVIQGESIADLNLMHGSCDAPKGNQTVWSLFGNPSTYPQAPTWAPASMTVRTFTTAVGVGKGMSNMWSFPCTKRPKPVNGATLADCLGPINESPFTGDHVLPGTTAGTGAPVGASDPVGGNFPSHF